MAVYAADDSILATPANGSRRVYGAIVSANLFEVLGVTPLIGRLFTATDDAPNSPRTVMISDRLWKTEFQGRKDVIGRYLNLDGRDYRVAGVVLSQFAFPIRKNPVDYWLTVAIDAEPSPWGGSIRASRSFPRYDAALVRLKPSVSLSQAQAELSTVASLVSRRHPSSNLKEGARISPALEDVVGGVRPLFWMLYGAVFCVLAVACANTATLLLVQAVAREREFALRAALGALPFHIIRQVLLESQAVALVGGVCGVALAWSLVELLVKLAPSDTPRLADIQPDGTIFAYALTITLLTGLLFGLAPVTVAVQNTAAGVLKDGMRTSPGRGHGWLRPATILIAAQIAVSMALGSAAAVLSDSFWRILHAPRGFDARNVLTASITLPSNLYSVGSQRITHFYEQLIARVSTVPGVVSVSTAQSLPLSGANNSTRVDVDGVAHSNAASADLRFVSPGYFQTLRIPLFEGRYLDIGDRVNRPQVVVVNRAFVAKFLGGRAPMGSRLRLGWGGDAPKQVVGVVGDVLHNTLGSEAVPEVYVPAAQFPINNMALVIRTGDDLAVVASSIAGIVAEQDRTAPVERIQTLEHYLLLTAAPQRFLMWILGAFASGAILLAAIGLYGSLSYSTSCRRHEYGIRIALGCKAGDLICLVLSEGLTVAALGIAAGLGLTVFVARFLRVWLYQTSPLNAPSLIFASGSLLVVAALACWAPARRASRVDASQSLRAD